MVRVCCAGIISFMGPAVYPEVIPVSAGNSGVLPSSSRLSLQRRLAGLRMSSIPETRLAIRMSSMSVPPMYTHTR